MAPVCPARCNIVKAEWGDGAAVSSVTAKSVSGGLAGSSAVEPEKSAASAEAEKGEEIFMMG